MQINYALHTSATAARQAHVSLLSSLDGDLNDGIVLTEKQGAEFDRLAACLWGCMSYVAKVDHEMVVLLDYEMGEQDDDNYGAAQWDAMVARQHAAIFEAIPKLKAQFPQDGINFYLAPLAFSYKDRPTFWATISADLASLDLSESVGTAMNRQISELLAAPFAAVA